jgi:hypothetical protein
MPPGLSGEFATMPMPDLVLYLGNRQLSGTLVVWNDKRKKSVFIAQGSVVNTASNDPREYLSQFMINFGHLSEDQVNRAMKAQADLKLPLGRVLVQLNLVPEETVRAVLTLKARETLLEVFRWPEGRFSFEITKVQPDGIQAPVSLLDLHREGEFRETAWQAIRQVFPNGEATLKIDESRVNPNSAGSMDAKLFEAIREGESIDEMVFSLHTTDFHLYQRIYALYRQGAVAPGTAKRKKASPPLPSAPAASAASGTVLGEETPLEGLLTHAKEFMSAGRYAEAEVLCQRILEISPGAPAALELMKQAEVSLHEALKAQLLVPSRVPELAVDAQRIRAPDLSPPEKYLLSRVDGLRDIRGIINVAPLRELEALKYFQRFIESGLVRLRA